MQSMCPTDPNQLNDMIYTQNHQIESSFLFQFYTNNGQVISSDLANNLQQQTCFIKQLTSESWLKVECGDNYEENDYLILQNERMDQFNGIFKIKFVDNDHFRITTKDRNGDLMYVTSKPDTNLLFYPNRKNGAFRVVLTSSKGIFLLRIQIEHLQTIVKFTNHKFISIKILGVTNIFLKLRFSVLWCPPGIISNIFNIDFCNLHILLRVTLLRRTILFRFIKYY